MELSVSQGMEVEEYNGEASDAKQADLRASRQGLPPTPPSSASSDSEGTASASCSPERRDSQSSAHAQNLRGMLTPRLYITNTTHTTRQPIHTPLISCQPVSPKTFLSFFFPDNTILLDCYNWSKLISRMNIIGKILFVVLEKMFWYFLKYILKFSSLFLHDKN